MWLHVPIQLRRLFSGRTLVALPLLFAMMSASPIRAGTTIEPGVDRPGADLTSLDLPQADPTLCRQACEEQAACKAYTYVKPGVQGPNARCWLKSSVPPAVSNPCCISGVKVLPVDSSGGSSGITNPGPNYRRTDEPSTARPGPGSSREGPSSKSAQNPGPLGRGTAVGSLNGKKNPNGFPGCSMGSPGLSKAVADVFGLLNNIFSEFGGSFTTDTRCGTFKREISTGVTLAPPQAPPGVAPRWGLLGGRGDLMANSTMCLLKDIGDAPNGKKMNRAPATVAGKEIDITQTVGLINFNPAARSVRLYQNVRICAPLLGCLDAQRQTIDAVIRESAPAWPGGYKLFDYPIANSYAVELTSDWSQASIGATLPPITIITPYGVVSAKPYLNYASRLLPVDTPFSYDGSAKHEFRYPQRNERPIILLQDHYGRAGMPFTLNVIANLPGAANEPKVVNGIVIYQPKSNSLPLGWVSQIGLGGRDGGLDAVMWKPGGSKQKPPQRQDFNMGQARSVLEAYPTVSFDAGVPIKYIPPDPTKLFPGLAGFADLTIEVVVNPSFKANYASQLEVLAREGILTGACGSAEIGNSCGFTEVALMSQAHAMGSIGISGYVYVKVDLIDNPFVDDFEIKRSFEGLKLDEDHGWEPAPEVKSVKDGHGKFAWAGHAASPWPNTALWQGAQGYSGMKTGNLAQWTQKCMQTAKNLSEPPPPAHDPGDAGDVTPELLPCNLCVASDNPKFAETGFKVSKFQSGMKPPACKTQMNNGCYDLCSWNKKTGAWIEVVKSGAQLFGQRCGGFTVK